MDTILRIEKLMNQLETLEENFDFLLSTSQLDLYEEMDYRIEIEELREEIEELQLAI